MLAHLSQTVYDMVRGISFTMFVIVLYQVGDVIYHYYRVLSLERRMGQPRSGLLPLHVVGVSLVLVWALTECAVQNVTRVGQPPNYFWFSNPFLFALTIWSLQMVRVFERGRYKYAVDLIPD